MPKIDPSLYQGRTFSPVIDAERGPGEGPVETSNLAPAGTVCVKFTAPAKPGATVRVKAGALPSTLTPAYPHGAWTMVAFSKTHGDFSGQATQGLEASLNGMVGGGRGYVTLDAGATYYANAALADPTDPGQPELRVQLSFT